jgi:trehalose 6-phosphate synthase/phosphatase
MRIPSTPPAGAAKLLLHTQAATQPLGSLAIRELGDSGASAGRLVIVSNRLPVTVRPQDGEVILRPSGGGLATGLRGIHARGGALWIGWSGAPAELALMARREVEQRLAASGAVGVPLGADEIEGFYLRFANGVLWPAMHDRVDLVHERPADWTTYEAVNARFADVVAGAIRPNDRVWIHDFHLMLLPRMLRNRVPSARIGFFLHTPFPAVESFAGIRGHAALLDGILGADVVGFHTEGDASRFVAAVDSALGRGGNPHEVRDGTRRVRVQACPMSIDVGAFESRAADPEVALRAAMLRRPGEALLLGVDRLDYTKGIAERLRAFARFLERNPERHGGVRLFQLAVPSRQAVPAYRALRDEVTMVADEVNARFGTDEWTPVELVHGTVEPLALSALYRAADVMLVTPLRDGMNLVAKEFVASRPDGDGVLVLSERAGAATELRAALLVDPVDEEEMALAYENALEMSPAERRVRMRHLRTAVRRHDVHQWARVCLLSLGREPSADADRTAG